MKLFRDIKIIIHMSTLEIRVSMFSTGTSFKLTVKSHQRKSEWANFWLGFSTVFY